MNIGCVQEIKRKEEKAKGIGNGYKILYSEKSTSNGVRVIINK